MIFLNPLYLWAFLGLAIPVAIHLWSRKEGRTIKVGSIKFLKESDPKHASSIRLNEIWLLILRMLALFILVLILAEPVLKTEKYPVGLTYIVEPSLLQHEEMSRILDTLDPEIDVKLLAAGFPEFTSGDEINNVDIPDYWQLAEEMQNLNSDSIVVFTAAYVLGFRGNRGQTDQNINWIQVIPDENINEPIAAIRKDDALEIISVSGDHTGLSFNKEETPVAGNNIDITASGDSIRIDHNGNDRYIPLRIADTLKISLFNDEDLREQTRYIRSSFIAISEYMQIPIKITDLSEMDLHLDMEDIVVWLSTSQMKETISKVIIWKPDSLANSLLEHGESKNVHYLTRSLNSENVIEENLPEQLLHLLNYNEDLEKEITKYDRRVMPLEEILPVTGSVGGKIEVNNSRDISKYLWIFLVIILVAERALSVYRKQ